MTTISKSWLRTHGVDGPDEDVVALAEQTEAALEYRVGISLLELLTEEQAEAFEELLDNGAPEKERLAFLDERTPGYKEVVRQETEALKQNIANADDPGEYIRNLKT